MADVLKVLSDKLKQKEVYDTKITVYVEGTDTILFEGKNKVILPGAILTACKHWGLTSPVTLPNYNDVLGINETGLNLTGSVNEQDKFVCLFCIGTDGCGPEQSQVYTVDFLKWISPSAMIPFKYKNINSDLNPEEREKYFGRKVIGNYAAYYYKAFETTPELKIQLTDGSAIPADIYTNTANTLPGEVFVEAKLKITNDDCREYFVNTVGINEAKVSSISLLTGFPVSSSDGYTYYRDVQPLTRLNIPVEPLIDTTKGLDIRYQIFY